MARYTPLEAAHTRQLLLDAAEEVFLQKGVAIATLEEIAHKAGVTRGAIYGHFANKTDLFVAMQERANEPLYLELKKALHEEAPVMIDAIHSAVLNTVHMITNDIHLRQTTVIILFKCEEAKENQMIAGHIAQQHQEFEQMIEQAFAIAHQRKEISTQINPSVAAQMLRMLMIGLFHELLQIHQTNIPTAEKRFLQIMNIFFASLKAPPKC